MIGNENPQRDPLLERLRREALAERPPFSPELHGRILRSVRGNGDAAGLKLAASSFFRVAAAVLLGAGLIALGAIYLRRSVPETAVVKREPPPLASALRADSVFSSIDIGGVVSARLFPPEVRIQLPAMGAAPLPEAPIPTAQPVSVLDDLDAPANSAGQTIAAVVPPSLRAMVKIAESTTFADSQGTK